MSTDAYVEFPLVVPNQVQTTSGEGQVIDTYRRGNVVGNALKVFLNISAFTGTAVQACFVVQGSVGGEFYDLKRFILKSGTGKDILVIQGCPRFVRLTWGLVGTTPDITFTATAFRTEDQFVADFTLEASMAQIPGWNPVLVIGTMPSTTTTYHTVWDVEGSSLVPLTTNTELFISSSSASDTGAVLIFGLDDDYIEKQEVHVLTGTTQVSVGNWYRINRMVNVSTATAVGDIYIAQAGTWTAGVPDALTDIQSKIILGQNITHNGFFSVPAGKFMIVTTNRASTSPDISKIIKVRNQISLPDQGQPLLTGTEFHVGDNFPQWLFPTPVGVTEFQGVQAAVLPAKSDIYHEAISSSVGGPTVFFGIDGWVVDHNEVR